MKNILQIKSVYGDWYIELEVGDLEIDKIKAILQNTLERINRRNFSIDEYLDYVCNENGWKWDYIQPNIIIDYDEE